jgi:adsorption protein B
MAWILLSGFDDLVLVAVLGAAWVRRFRSGAASPPSMDRMRARPEKRIAILVPLWQEQEVIGRMVERNLAAIRYQACDFFIGAYPNDQPTVDAVRDLEARFSSVHLALCPHSGPTSKADCLNWIYRRLVRFEQERSLRYEVLVTHDAEDVIHPDSLLLINYYADDYDMVQVPVLPLPTPLGDLTHGVYCDEFAEYQTKDIPVRQLLGGFIPSNGVGTGYTRRALERLAQDSSNRIFEPASLTEDYENGLRLNLLGCRQIFVASTHWRRPPVATRGYFPRSAADAIRQRTRWVTGIALQSWERHGWRGGVRQIYWLWRDRKGLLGNLVTVAANLVFLWGAGTWAVSQATGTFWALPRFVPPLPRPAVEAALLLPLLHLGVRAVCAGRLYGWLFAAGVPLRTVWANWLNFAATAGALWRYTAAKLRSRPLEWLKTEHAYPDRAALLSPRRKLGEILVESGVVSREQVQYALQSLPPNVRLGERLLGLGWLSEWQLYEALSRQDHVPLGQVGPQQIQRNACRALPARFAREWKILPFKIMSGSLFLAAAELPGEDLRHRLGRFTRLEIRFQLVTATNFQELTRDALR